jgi:hypothetical protein
MATRQVQEWESEFFDRQLRDQFANGQHHITPAGTPTWEKTRMEVDGRPHKSEGLEGNEEIWAMVNTKMTKSWRPTRNLWAPVIWKTILVRSHVPFLNSTLAQWRASTEAKRVVAADTVGWKIGPLEKFEGDNIAWKLRHRENKTKQELQTYFTISTTRRQGFSGHQVDLSCSRCYCFVTLIVERTSSSSAGFTASILWCLVINLLVDLQGSLFKSPVVITFDKANQRLSWFHQIDFKHRILAGRGHGCDQLKWLSIPIDQPDSFSELNILFLRLSQAFPKGCGRTLRSRKNVWRKKERENREEFDQTTVVDLELDFFFLLT